MGANSSTIHSSIGGVSKKFPIGTFVRIARKLSQEDINSENCMVWAPEMDKTIGNVGIVIGGGMKGEDIATVASLIENEIVGNHFTYENSCLEEVSSNNVPLHIRERLNAYMYGEMRKVIYFMAQNRCTEISKFGPAGAIVCVSHLANTTSWPSHQLSTMNQYGIIVGGNSNNTTKVVFPEPIFYLYNYDAESLVPSQSQSLDDLTLLPENYVALSKLRSLVVDTCHSANQKL